jgi:hypothetical protein
MIRLATILIFVSSLHSGMSQVANFKSYSPLARV